MIAGIEVLGRRIEFYRKPKENPHQNPPPDEPEEIVYWLRHGPRRKTTQGVSNHVYLLLESERKSSHNPKEVYPSYFEEHQRRK